MASIVKKCLYQKLFQNLSILLQDTIDNVGDVF